MLDEKYVVSKTIIALKVLTGHHTPVTFTKKIKYFARVRNTKAVKKL